MDGNSDKDALVELGFMEAVHRRMPDDPEVLKTLGDLYTKCGRWREGLDIDLRLTATLPGDPLVWYNLACSYALLKLKDEAFGALARATGLGYADFEWLRQDDDLESLRDDPRFEALAAGKPAQDGGAVTGGDDESQHGG